MRLSRLNLKNFRCYRENEYDFHPNINLIVGENATGKTALLDAIAVSTATWFLGFKQKLDTKPISATDATIKFSSIGDEPSFEATWPVEVSAIGVIDSKQVSWKRSKHSESGNTRYGEATQLIDIAKQIDLSDAANSKLPLLAYYGTMRLWQDPRVSKKASIKMGANHKPSRLDGYKHSLDPRIPVRELIKWFGRQAWRAFQEGKEPIMLNVVKDAVLCCIDNGESLNFNAKSGELTLKLKNSEPQPFSILSDGQRCIVSLVADIAQKAVKLNPHLGKEVLKQTEGIVLVDELDLHLHPKWQRGLIENLRAVFPKIQFFFTTHSPFLIQSLRSGDELFMLNGDSTAVLSNKTLEDIAIGIMGVSEPQVSIRYKEMKAVATEYLRTLYSAETAPEEKLETYKERLANKLAPYSDNPAFQAFLELKRTSILGE